MVNGKEKGMLQKLPTLSQRVKIKHALSILSETILFLRKEYV